MCYFTKAVCQQRTALMCVDQYLMTLAASSWSSPYMKLANSKIATMDGRLLGDVDKLDSFQQARECATTSSSAIAKEKKNM